MDRVLKKLVSCHVDCDPEFELEEEWYESKEAIRWAIECSGKCVRGSLVHRCAVWDEAC